MNILSHRLVNESFHIRLPSQIRYEMKTASCKRDKCLLVSGRNKLIPDKFFVNPALCSLREQQHCNLVKAKLYTTCKNGAQKVIKQWLSAKSENRTTSCMFEIFLSASSRSSGNVFVLPVSSHVTILSISLFILWYFCIYRTSFHGKKYVKVLMTWQNPLLFHYFVWTSFRNRVQGCSISFIPICQFRDIQLESFRLMTS